MKNSYNSFASQCMKGASIKNAMVATIGRILQSEIAALCSDDFDSIMRLKTKGSVKDFNHIISTINKDLQTKTPTLLSLLQWCFQKKLSSNTDVLIATIVSIMCKHRRMHTSEDYFTCIVLWALKQASKKICQNE